MPPDLARNPGPFVPSPRAVLIDAGFTFISFEGERVARIAAERGLSVDAAAVEATEATLRAEIAQHEWPQRPDSAAPSAGGARFMRRMLELAAGDPNHPAVPPAAELVWARHLEDNLWSRIYDGVVPALQSLRAAGLRLVVVSNSEGTLHTLLDRLDLSHHFDAIIDSWKLEITKPDPRIFQAALAAVAIPAREAVMVGDSLKVDVRGAQAAGLQAALIDPENLYTDAGVPRFATFPQFATAVLASLPLPLPAP